MAQEEIEDLAALKAAVPADVVLHIGPMKTGSTAIRNAFEMNQAFLLDRRLLFPTSILDLHPLDSRRTPGHLRFLSEWRQGADSLLAELRQAEGKAGRLFLSAEDIFHAFDAEALEPLRAFLEGKNVTLLAILQPQLPWCASLHAEFVTGGWRREKADFAEFTERLLSEGKLDFHARLQTLSELLGARAVVAVDYERAGGEGGAVAAALAALGIDEPLPERAAGSEGNVPVSFPEAVEAHRRLNGLADGLAQDEYFAWCAEMTAAADALARARGIPASPARAGSALRRRVRDACGASNRRLSEAFLGGRPFGPEEGDAREEEPAPLDPQLVAVLIERGIELMAPRAAAAARRQEARSTELGEPHAGAAGSRDEVETLKASLSRLQAESEQASTEASTELARVRAELQAQKLALAVNSGELSRMRRSTSWRMTAPIRLIKRNAVALLRGRPATLPGKQRGLSSAPARLERARGVQVTGDGRASDPPWPGGPARQGNEGILAANVQAAAGQIGSLLQASDFDGLYLLMKRLEQSLAFEEGFVAYHFLMVTWCKKISAFGFGAQSAGIVFGRYHEMPERLAALLGPRAFRRLVADAAMTLTRLGRYEEGQALMAGSIAGGSIDLLPVRAEISWVRDPEQAFADLAAFREAGAGGRLKEGDELLLRHLAVNVLRQPERAGLGPAEAGQPLLVEACAARSEGDFGRFRTLLNRFFEGEGLSAPLAPSDEPFSFEALRSDAARSIEDGPPVTVVMTAYNSAATIRYSARSILDQTYANLELLIVDDGSTDETRDLLAEIAAGDERVKLLLNERNLGTYGAKNKAIQAARGDYVTCHDSDDWAHPQRIETHVRIMRENPNLAASRSCWLRIGADGALDFRRWHRRFLHPNPASNFFSQAVIRKIGFFDHVRFTADTEYWFRIAKAFGRQAVSESKLPLGLGLHHERSLTRAGAGAMGEEQYSPARSAYTFSETEWHARTGADGLFLDAVPAERKFWAPPEMLGAEPLNNGRLVSTALLYPGLLQGGAAAPSFVFGISLASRQASADWARTETLLGRTLRSVLAQTDPRFRVLVCGHDRPDLAELDDPRILFTTADIEPPADSSKFRRDKMWKRRTIGALLRDLGGGYFFPLDADDLVHRRLVEHVLADDNRRGYNIGQGYAEDFNNRRLAPVPGAWSVPFDRVCGSSAVIFFEPEELPRHGQSDPDLYFNLFQSHAYWPIVAEESGRPLAAVPFPAAVYVVNHSQNLSFGLQRAGQRRANIIAAIKLNALPRGEAVLAQEFGQTGPAAQPGTPEPGTPIPDEVH